MHPVAGDADFVTLGAAEAPVAGSGALDEGFFDDALGLEVGVEVVEESVEFFAGFGAVAVEDEDLLGEEDVLESVRAGAGAPNCRFRIADLGSDIALLRALLALYSYNALGARSGWRWGASASVRIPVPMHRDRDKFRMPDEG